MSPLRVRGAVAYTTDHRMIFDQVIAMRVMFCDAPSPRPYDGPDAVLPLAPRDGAVLPSDPPRGGQMLDYALIRGFSGRAALILVRCWWRGPLCGLCHESCSAIFEVIFPLPLLEEWVFPPRGGHEGMRLEQR
jgi:hypothetical protein